MTASDFGRFEALTFDCYGTLIDWETGLTNAFKPIFRGRGVEAPADAVLERFAVHEAAAEAGPYRRYRDVLALALRGVTAEYGVEPTADEIEAFSGSVGEWPAFPDTAAALARLKERFKLGVITNCDDDLFAASLPRLGVAFDWVVTAQQVGAYKPSTRNFELAFERIGPPARPDPARRPEPLPRPRSRAAPGPDERVDRPPRGSPGCGRNPACRSDTGRDLPRHGLVRGGRDRLTRSGHRQTCRSVRLFRVCRQRLRHACRPNIAVGVPEGTGTCSDTSSRWSCVAHGIGHSIGIMQSLRIATVNPDWNGDSWLITGFAGTSVTQAVGVLVWTAALVGFVLAAAVVVGWLPATWWAPLAVGSSLLSLAGLLLFPAAFPMTSTLGALVVDMVVLAAVLWADWTPSDLPA